MKNKIIPDEAVQVAAEVICAHDNAQWGDSGSPDMYHDLVGKMLTAALPFLTGVKVKALEWHDCLKTSEREGFICSEGGVLSYSIMLSKFRVYGVPGPHDGAQEYDTLEDAKAAAQADYEARIRSAIEPTPSPRAQALEEGAILEALEECETYFDDLSDADHDGTGFVANKEMRILISVRAAIRALSQPVATGGSNHGE